MNLTYQNIPISTNYNINQNHNDKQVIFCANKHSTKQTAKKSHIPITIQNYHHVDKVLTRGAKPIEAQITELKNHGYSTIISFCTNYDPNHPNSQPKIPDEAKWAKKAGIKFYWMPFSSRTNPPKDYVKKFFDITDNARLNGERVFMHCRHGADRTGAFAAMYKIRNYNISATDAIKEMFKYGHNANGNKNLIPFITDFKANNGIFGFNIKGPMIRFAANLKIYFQNILKQLQKIKIK